MGILFFGLTGLEVTTLFDLPGVGGIIAGEKLRFDLAGSGQAVRFDIAGLGITYCLKFPGVGGIIAGRECALTWLAREARFDLGLKKAVRFDLPGV